MTTGEAFGTRTCPDCGMTTVNGFVRHSPGCPLLLDMDRTDADDFQWFEDHPDALLRRRAMSWEERDTTARSYGLSSAHTISGTTIVHPVARGELLKLFVVALPLRGEAS